MLFTTVVQKLNNAAWTERAVYRSVFDFLVLLRQSLPRTSVGGKRSNKKFVFQQCHLQRTLETF